VRKRLLVIKSNAKSRNFLNFYVRKVGYNEPLLSFIPGIAFMLNAFSFNMEGDGLTDALDPRLRGASPKHFDEQPGGIDG
jgi:hypothetical protein